MITSLEFDDKISITENEEDKKDKTEEGDDT
jgi:hypothetical protein